MPFFAGQKGRMLMRDGTSAPRLGTDDVVKVVNWSFNQTQNVIDVTSLGDTDRVLCAGVRQLTGSCRVFYYNYGSGSNLRNDCARILNRIMKLGPNSNTEATPNGDPTYGQNADSDEVVFRLYIEAGTTDRWVDIPAYITSVTMNMAVGEVVAADVTFEASGAALGTSNMAFG
jgi:hypothetical protein